MTEVLSYRNQSIDLQSKSMDGFLYNRDLRHERVKHSQWNTANWFAAFYMIGTSVMKKIKGLIFQTYEMFKYWKSGVDI